MATTHRYTSQISSSQRPVAMLLALASAVVLSPLYVRRSHNDTRYDIRWNSGLLLPAVLALLIIAIRTTSSTSSSSRRGDRESVILPSDPSWVLRIGSSSWGLAGVLIMLMLVLSWQDSVQHFFWK